MAGSKAQKKKGWRLKVNLGLLAVFLWGIFILFFMSWIFVLGIFVGRGFAPDEITDISELKEEIIRLKKPIENETQEETHSAPSDTAEETEPELVFYERLTAKKDEAKNNLHTEGTKAVRDVSPPVPAPAPAATQAAGTGSVKPSDDSKGKSGSGQYTIQVASISELANAEKTVKELLEKGFDAYYYEATVKGKRYYRIRCGRFSNRAEARVYSLKLEEKTGLKGYVTSIE